MSAVHPAALEHVPFRGAEVLQRPDRQGDHAENGDRWQNVYGRTRRHAVEDRRAVPRQRQPLYRDREAERTEEQRADVRAGAADPGKVNRFNRSRQVA